MRAPVFRRVSQAHHTAGILWSLSSIVNYKTHLGFITQSSSLTPSTTQRQAQSPRSLGAPKSLATLVNVPLPNVIKESLPAKTLPNTFQEDLPALEQYLYACIQKVPASASLASIYQGYKSNAGRVLDTHLPYEPRPKASRRADLEEDDGVVLLAHVAITKTGRCKVGLSSGFVLASEEHGQQGIVTCCHTLEEISRTIGVESLLPPSGIYAFPSSGDATPIPVTGVLSSLPRHDILLLSIPSSSQPRALPLSPYPAPEGSRLSTRLFSSPGRPELQGTSGWVEWLGHCALRKWVAEGKVLGYRDLAGRESKTGTYDALSHMLFDILPTPGSSGAPLIDEYGAVVGMALGTRMDNRVEGNRGWGVPAELIFEMFSLPGLKLNK